MFTWVKLILSMVHFVPMLFISMVLFRIRIKSHWRQISLAILAGTVFTMIIETPMTCVFATSLLLMVVWKYRVISALFISLTGYLISVLISTTVIVCVNLTQAEAYIEIKDDLVISIVTRFLILVAKCAVLLALYKWRLGFTFLSNYTRIPFVRENASIYLYMVVVIIGMIYRHSLRDHVLSAVMPIQMLSLALILFIASMLRKEVYMQR